MFVTLEHHVGAQSVAREIIGRPKLTQESGIFNSHKSIAQPRILVIKV